MNYPHYEPKPFHEKVDEIVARLLNFLCRLFTCAVHMAICAIPFIVIEDKSNATFWYCVGAYGVYLLGASQFLLRRY